MEERDPELPVATLRPRRLLGRLVAARGALSRWVRSRLRTMLHGRHAPLLLTGIFFSGMLLAMGYLADRTQRAAEAIDEARRAARERRLEEESRALALPPVPDPWRTAAARTDGPQALFYVSPTSR